MSLHRVLLADMRPQPWRNGGGSMRELLSWPPQAGADAHAEDWTVRVSVAEIERDGPFSHYPGIERWFAVLEGTGVALALPQGERQLARGETPVQFAGEAAPGCRLLGGATRDLNLMVRRASGVGQMRLARLGDPFAAAGARWLGLYAASAIRVQAGTSDGEARGAIETLAPGTLLWTEAPGAEPWHVQGAGLAYWMSLSP